MTIGKHIPQRTCLACGKIRPQWEMVRLVCSKEMNVELDIKRKKPGRGAYLCRLPGCWQIGLKGNKLERALRANLSSDYREKLTQALTESFGGQDK